MFTCFLICYKTNNVPKSFAVRAETADDAVAILKKNQPDAKIVSVWQNVRYGY